MSGKGAVGWLILAVALAVPAFMFWNWWKTLNTRQPEGKRAVAGPVFSGTQMAQNLQNPLGSKPAPAGPTEAAPAPAPVEGTAAAPVQAPAGSAPALTASATGQAGDVAEGSHAPLASGATEQAAVSASPESAAPESAVEKPGLQFTPKVDRDPMLSPMDVKRLAQIELEKEWEAERIRRAAEEALKKKEEQKIVKKKLLPPIEDSITLQGITAVRGSITAIVNDDIRRAGEVFEVERGDQHANVRILKITPTTVTFQHGKKRWSESISQ